MKRLLAPFRIPPPYSAPASRTHLKSAPFLHHRHRQLNSSAAISVRLPRRKHSYQSLRSFDAIIRVLPLRRNHFVVSLLYCFPHCLRKGPIIALHAHHALLRLSTSLSRNSLSSSRSTTPTATRTPTPAPTLTPTPSTPSSSSRTVYDTMQAKGTFATH